MEVDLAAIVANVALVRELCPSSKVLAILKGDAYGVGADRVAGSLQRSGVEGFGVDNVAEGIALRASGIHRKIVVLDGCVPENAELAVRYELTPGISTEVLLRAYADAAERAGLQLPIWLNYNSGFNRSGHRAHADFRRFLRTVGTFKALLPTTVYSHLPATHLDAAETQRQTAEYELALKIARDELGIILESSLLASHGILNEVRTFEDAWVRPGIILYGSACFDETALTTPVAARVDQLRPALTLHARLIHKMEFQSDQHCGLGQKYAVKAGQTLGTVALGFGNGLPVPSGPWPASYAFRGHQYPLVTVGMDYSQIDLTQLPAPDQYGWLTLFGDPKLGHPSLRQFATNLGMSAWVLMRQLNVVRRYLEPESGHPTQAR